jgi:hypothetical protein
MTKRLISLVLALAFCIALPVSAVDIIWVSDGYDDKADGVSDDLPWVDMLTAQGYNVDYQIVAIGNGYWRTLDDAKIAALNAADLVIVSRNSDSGQYATNAAEVTQWGSVTAPLILMSTHIARSSRWKVLNTTTINSAVPVMQAVDAGHPIFAGVALDASGQVQAMTGGSSSFPGIANAGNGTVIATRADTGDIWIATWPAGVEYYAGAAVTTGGPRMFFVGGTQEVAATATAPAIGRGENNLTAEGEKIFLNAVAMYAPLPEPVYDVTSPGDAVLGVPNDGDWPAGEYPALAIDNKSGTKFLHRKGSVTPTGIVVTPSAGPTLVTGLTLTTANDAPTRDPIAYELSGSNVGVDGPFEVIAAGDVVDFAGAANWPRFTKNTTPIEFANAVVYAHYKIVFPRLRGATEALMQIAEIELLGTSLGAFAPTPSNRAVGVPIDAVLSWSPGSSMASQDVYFGTEAAPALVANQAETSYDPGLLEYGTTYYWRVDTVKKDGSVQAGNVWSFTTTTPVGIFEYSRDVGDPAGVGKTVFEGYVWKDDILTQQYLIQAGGADIWGVNDQFQFAYNTVSGAVRISAGFEWVAASNEWAKYGVMLRANDTGPAVNYANFSRRDNNLASFQWRESQGASSGNVAVNRPAGVTKPKRVGIQRVEALGLTWIEGLVDWGTGKGWEPVGSPRLATANLPDEVLAGVAVTSHDNTHLSQVRAYDVTYELNPTLVGTFPTIGPETALAAPPGNVSGFKIRSIKSLVTDGSFNTFAAIDELLDTGMFKGLPAQPGSEGTRVDQYVNVRDTGNGAFSAANGYPDKSYPGVDPLEDPAADPAAGDDDNDFATEILAYIHLTPGTLYKVGANSDDGTYIVIGGVEVLRTAATKGNSNIDSNFFQVAAEGYYPLKARHLERSGGASVELHQILLDGTRILLNDVAHGGAEVFAAP